MQCVVMNKSEDEKTGSLTFPIGSIPIYSLLINTQFLRKQNGLKLK